MKYQRQHYEDIARIIRDVRSQDTDERTMTKIEQEFTLLFVSDNSRFDRDRFERACN